MATSQFDKNVEAFKKVAVIMAALEELHSSEKELTTKMYLDLIKSNGISNEKDAFGILDFWNTFGGAFVA